MTDLTLTLLADYESAREIGPWLSASLAELESPQAARLGELELAVHELAINIVDHAYGNNGMSPTDQTYSIALEAVQADRGVQVRFVDRGKPFGGDAPTPDLNEPQVGGYGLFITEQLASSIAYERIGDINQWTLVFCSPDPTQNPTPTGAST